MLASKLAFQIEKAKLEAPRSGGEDGDDDMEDGIEDRLQKVLAGA